MCVCATCFGENRDNASEEEIKRQYEKFHTPKNGHMRQAMERFQQKASTTKTGHSDDDANDDGEDDNEIAFIIIVQEHVHK